MNKLKCLFLSGLMAVMPVCMSGQQTPGEKSSKPRVIITCDPELDDLNSLIRFLLFSTDFRVEGLIYASRDRKSTRLNSSHIEESRMPSSA